MTKRRQRKPRLPRIDWRKAVRLLAGPVAEAEAKGSSEAPGRQSRPGHGKALASEGGECPVPPPRSCGGGGFVALGVPRTALDTVENTHGFS